MVFKLLKYCWTLFVIALIISIFSHYLLIVEYNNSYSAIASLSGCLAVVLAYFSLLVYDISANNFKRLKFLYYLLIGVSLLLFFYAVFIDVWMGGIAIYFGLAALSNLVIMSFVKTVWLKESDVRLKTEWLLLLFSIILFFMIYLIIVLAK